MNAYAQAKHLFWKEYRTQRGLWLLVISLYLVGMVLIQSLRPNNMNLSHSELFTGGVLTTLFYLLASTSLLYASEKEQETDRWLRVLPTNPWLVLGLKVSWVLLSSLLGLGIFFVASRFIGDQDGYFSSVDTLRAWFFFFAFVFSTALISTQLSKNVLSAIGLTIALLIMLLFGTIYLFQEFLAPFLRSGSATGDFLRAHPRIADNLVWIPCIIWALIPLELNRRWFRDSDFSWRWSWRLTRAKTLAIALEDAPYSSQSRRLVWKEWQSAHLWLPCLFAFSFFFVNLTHIGPGPFSAEHRFIFFAINMCLIPLLAGFASCRRDQSQDRYRFLGNRGVNSNRILWTKHAVWMSGCLLILLFASFFVWTSSKQVDSHRQMDFAGSLYLIPISTGLLPSAMVERLNSSLIPAIQFWACLSLLFYALGHWFSISHKQPVLSLMLALFTSIFLGGCVIFYYALGVPLFILTIVPSVALFSISFLWGEDWLADRRERRDLLRPYWYGLLGIWTVITLLESWRVMEIPWSTTIDTSGLYNLPVVYGVLCFLGLLFIAAVLLTRDWFRNHFRTSAGKSMLAPRRDFQTQKVVIGFLIFHNLGCLAIVQGHQAIQNWHWDQNTELVVADIYRLDDEDKKEDLYTVAEDAIGSPLPFDDQLPAGVRPTGQVLASLTWDSWAEVTPEQKTWYRENRDTLKLFWEADEAGILHSNFLNYGFVGIPHPAGYDSHVVNQTYSFFERHMKVLHLVRLEALRLEHEGQLEESWKHHIAVVRYARRFTEQNFASVRWTALDWLERVMLNHDLCRWMAREEQTPELLARAARELSEEIRSFPSLEENTTRESVWTLSLTEEIPSWALVMEENLGAGMPWEKQRIEAMLYEQTRLAQSLARQIDNQQVHSEITGESPQNPTMTYTFEQYYHSALFGQPFLPKIVLQPRSGQHSLQMSLITSASRPAPPRQKSEFDWYQSGPPGKQESSLFEVKVPQFSTITQMTNDHLTEVLVSELDFWRTYRIVLSNFAIYSYRAETGHFPGALFQLKGTRTEELFDPILPPVAVNTVEPEPDQLTWIAGILQYDANIRSYKADYNWFHASKWPQPEYNLGDTPDRKPMTPLIAPEPKKPHPEEFLPEYGFGMGQEFTPNVRPITPQSSEAQP
ncbi:MAG: hypothetical protein HUJ26_20920 [Planctomycetaceae bacterium]|nr:hypothetical protein [Planctomycetaceae bacterium]